MYSFQSVFLFKILNLPIRWVVLFFLISNCSTISKKKAASLIFQAFHLFYIAHPKRSAARSICWDVGVFLLNKVWATDGGDMGFLVSVSHYYIESVLNVFSFEYLRLQEHKECYQKLGREIEFKRFGGHSYFKMIKKLYKDQWPSRHKRILSSWKTPSRPLLLIIGCRRI